MPSETTVRNAGKPVMDPQTRYPGSLPFQDGDLARRLFFGREQEAELLFYKILVDELVVLYSRSGLGKTSLLNAGVLKKLRERQFFPMMCRVYAPFQNGVGKAKRPDPLSSIYLSMELMSEKALQQGKLSECPFKKDTSSVQVVEKAPDPSQTLNCQLQEYPTLWEFFKTAEFWSADGIRLVPVLILDQFEELFTMYNREERRAFIAQLADLVRGNVPETLQQMEGPAPEPPEIKVVIAMREEYLAHLAELAPHIPSIRRSEFRLTPLQREQAMSAIVQPAGAGGLPVTTPSFSYAPETIRDILDFLTKSENSPEYFEEDEVDPSQLQLLCQYIEEKVREVGSLETSGKIIVDARFLRKEELSGIIKKFYDRTIDSLPEMQRSAVIKMLENGLISDTGKRLGLAQEDILRRFQVSPETLKELLESNVCCAQISAWAPFTMNSGTTPWCNRFWKPKKSARNRKPESASKKTIKRSWPGNRNGWRR